MTVGATSKDQNGEKDHGVLVGPDLNPSRTPLDKKLYRQIMLPNGLRALLISDTIAMHQQQNAGYHCNGEDEEEDDDSSEEGSDEDDSSHDEDDHDDEEGDDDDDEGLRDAAAAVLVGVGSMYDPPEAQGLAHFLEHMLFMGTEKYPTENAFDAFLSKNGGTDNAYTEFEHTVYHLEIPQEGLFQALDMMAQFFVHPLMLEDAVERELNIIESEFQLSKRHDQSRLLSLMAQTSGKDPSHHPFSRFSWGNLKSLKEIPEKNNVNVMEELRKFYNMYYYAANMRLVVIGAYTLDELQNRVVRYFANVPPEPREPSPLQARLEHKGTWKETCHSAIANFGMPFAPESMGKIYRMVPVKDSHSLNITWQLPPQFHYWKSKPCDYIAHLLGHESEGSLLSSLKAKSWATTLYAGQGEQGFENASSHALFSLSVTLSEEGVSNWRHVVQKVFTYIGMLRHYCSLPDGMPDWIYEELRSIHLLSYRYEDESPAEDLVEEIVEDMAPTRNSPPERLLDGTALLFEYNAEAVEDILNNYLTASNARFDLMSSTYGRATDSDEGVREDYSLTMNFDFENVEFDGDFRIETAGKPHVDPIFGTRFWCHAIPEEIMNEWTDATTPRLPPASSLLSLPPVNPFVPKNFDLKPVPMDDSHHPLLHCSLKICVTIGKRKSWFPATATKFDATKNHLLLSYEDEDEKWHKMDLLPSELSVLAIAANFEGTMDDKSVKYRIVSVPVDGKGSVMKFGDESDHNVDGGIQFPPIPPALSESRLPQLICDTKALKLWHLQDRKFKRPIAELRLRIICAEAMKTPFYAACADLFVTLFADAVTEISYLASVCELGSSIETSDVGFVLRIHGFDDKLMDLSESMLKLLFQFRGRSEEDGLPDAVKPGRFDACLEMLHRRYANRGLQASSLCSDIRLRCLRPETWSAYEKTLALVDLTVPSFVRAISWILRKIAVEAFYHGNVDQSDADAATSLLTKLMNESGGGGIKKDHYPPLEVIKVPLRDTPILVVVPTKDPVEPNTAVEVYFQIGKDNIVERVLIDLIVHMMHEPLYDQVRTKDQFGYSVSCDSRWTYGVMGLHFRVVTSTKSAAETAKRIDQFIRDFRLELDGMTQDEFTENLVGLAKHKLLMATSLEEECGYLWSEIRDQRYEWQVHRNEASCLRAVTKESVLSAYDEWLMPTDPGGNTRKRRAMAVQVISKNDGAASVGRPQVEESGVGGYIDTQVRQFQDTSGNATWGGVL